MFGRFGRRGVELLVLLFAGLGFAFVPLGKKTGLEHARAILATGPAAEAGRGLVEGARRLRQALVAAPEAEPREPSHPRPRHPAKPPADAKLAPAREAPDGGADASACWPES